MSDSSPSNHRDYAGRVFLTPFAGAGDHPLGELGFGMAASGGNVDGQALPTFRSFGQNTFLTFNTGVIEAGHRTRTAPRAYYYAGPFGLLGEYTVSKQGLQKGAARHDVSFRAWQVQASYLVTGERKTFNSPAPERVFNRFNGGGWGALELAVRTGNFAADTGIFGFGFLDPAKSPRQAREWVGGANWYLNRLVRLSLDYGSTNFRSGARPDEKVLVTRFQINFI